MSTPRRTPADRIRRLALADAAAAPGFAAMPLMRQFPAPSRRSALLASICQPEEGRQPR
jgi:hypothetical protein